MFLKIYIFIQFEIYTLMNSKYINNKIKGTYAVLMQIYMQEKEIFIKNDNNSRNNRYIKCARRY